MHTPNGEVSVLHTTMAGMLDLDTFYTSSCLSVLDTSPFPHVAIAHTVLSCWIGTFTLNLGNLNTSLLQHVQVKHIPTCDLV